MANKRAKRSRNSKNFAALPVTGSLALSTLGNVTVLLNDLLGANLTEDFYGISMDLSAQVIDLTAGEGDPMILGIAHGDYNITEIKEALEVKLLGPGNKIEQERSRRLIRKIGTFLSNSSDAGATVLKLFGRGGAGITRTKIKFVIQSGKSINLFVYNQSGAALTTGGLLKFQGTIYGRWIL